MIPKLSIIIPAYNAEGTISRCLKSIITYPADSFEVIVVNDGSTDSTQEILAEFEYDKRIMIINQINQGVSGARNTGIKAAKGDYLFFVDSDDYLCDSSISIIEEHILSNPFDIIFFGFNTIVGGKIYEKNYKNGFSEFFSSKDIYIGVCKLLESKVFGYACNKIIKREIVLIHNLKFDNNIDLFEDQYFFMKFLQYCNSMYISNLSVYNYEIFSTGLSSIYREDYSNLCENMYHELGNFLCSLNTPMNLVNAQLASYGYTAVKTSLANIGKCRGGARKKIIKINELRSLEIYNNCKFNLSLTSAGIRERVLTLAVYLDSSVVLLIYILIQRVFVSYKSKIYRKIQKQTFYS